MTPIPVEQLHTVWDWVEQGLREVKAKRHESWCPADVYVQLRCKSAHLLVVEDAGFLIYQIFPGDDFRGVFHIWIVWGKLAPHEKQMYEELDALARRLGVARIRGAGRKGWARGGFVKLVGYLFEREL